MIIEVKQDKIRIGSQQLYMILVDGEVKYSNLTYEELIAVTIGDLDKMEGIE